ncbi:hypothetical protein ES703_24977 [subsurface metagenome]
MSVPKRLVVEYEDSSTQEVDFGKVDSQMRFKLAELGLCPPPDHVGSSKHYLLLRWHDGWQEVLGIDKDSVELLRYYVIQRIEDRGRLSLEVGADWPELFIIRRTPRELIGLLIVSDGSVKSYELESEVERWEGIFEAGGKKEYVKYDKTDSQYPQGFSEAPEALDKLMDSLKGELDSRGLSPQKLLAMDESRRIAEYKEVARGAGIRGSERQEDVYGFIELMVRRLAALRK